MVDKLNVLKVHIGIMVCILIGVVKVVKLSVRRY